MVAVFPETSEIILHVWQGNPKRPLFKHVLARHVCAQCMIVGCAVHKTLSCRAVKCGLCCPLQGRETLSVYLQGKHGLRVFENMRQREVFGTKEIELTGDWRKL